MVTLFLRQGENGKQVLLSFPATTPAEKADVAATMESLKFMSKTVTIQGAASEVMNLGLYLSGVDLAAEGEVESIDQLAERLEHMSEVDCDKFAGMLDANSISGTKDILQLTGRPVKNIWTAFVRNCHTEQRAAFLFVQSRRTQLSAKQWMILCSIFMARKIRAVKKIII